MKKETVYHINTSTLGKLSEAVDDMIADAGRDSTIRDIYFSQDTYGDGTIQSTDFHITVEGK